MKKFADAKRSERKFKIEDWVYLKLQPYRQITIQKRGNTKLAPKYYGPFEIIAKIGIVAYELRLPPRSLIHPVFHVSQLRERVGTGQAVAPGTPLTYPQLIVKEKPEGILGRRMVKRDNAFNQEILIKWENGTEEDASWEDYEAIREKFPDFILRDKDIFKGEGMSRNMHNGLLVVDGIDLVNNEEEEGRGTELLEQALYTHFPKLNKGAQGTGSSFNEMGQEKKEALTMGPNGRDVNSLNGVKEKLETEATMARE